MLMWSPGNFQDLREQWAANSFNEQYTSIFEKIPVLDQGRAMRGLYDWGFTGMQRQALMKVLNGPVSLTRFCPRLSYIAFERE